MVDKIRPFHTSDLYPLYRICLLTGADGGDATGSIDDEILGHFFAAPYAVLEPELCSILTHHGAPVGYILGTADSNEFARQAEQHWWPRLREKYPLPHPEDSTREAMMIHAIHRGYQAPTIAERYPAHLHIDLLPTGQGRGLGGQLIERFIAVLTARKVPGLHLGVSKANQRALNWYPRFGFEIVEESKTGVTFGMLL